mmetsp:Transcript_61153/g.172385  ORF Transcript_61153/g.172385 Transcript_61153/m.172385 type:complete len:459 (+) Transcript_61153:430-1806(+)
MLETSLRASAWWMILSLCCTREASWLQLANSMVRTSSCFSLSADPICSHSCCSSPEASATTLRRDSRLFRSAASRSSRSSRISARSIAMVPDSSRAARSSSWYSLTSDRSCASLSLLPLPRARIRWRDCRDELASAASSARTCCWCALFARSSSLTAAWAAIVSLWRLCSSSPSLRRASSTRSIVPWSSPSRECTFSKRSSTTCSVRAEHSGLETSSKSAAPLDGPAFLTGCAFGAGAGGAASAECAVPAAAGRGGERSSAASASLTWGVSTMVLVLDSCVLASEGRGGEAASFAPNSALGSLGSGAFEAEVADAGLEQVVGVLELVASASAGAGLGSDSDARAAGRRSRHFSSTLSTTPQKPVSRVSAQIWYPFFASNVTFFEEAFIFSPWTSRHGERLLLLNVIPSSFLVPRLVTSVRDSPSMRTHATSQESCGGVWPNSFFLPSEYQKMIWSMNS